MMIMIIDGQVCVRLMPSDQPRAAAECQGPDTDSVTAASDPGRLARSVTVTAAAAAACESGSLRVSEAPWHWQSPVRHSESELEFTSLGISKHTFNYS